MMLGLPPNAVPLPAVAFVSIGLFSNVLVAKASLVISKVPVVPVVKSALNKVIFKSSI